ncbi:MAG TPA: trehalose-phosphatase [Alphaproteobacteria bacterium]|nr:trehalose-phosphatase [Alphaproteobacteria bacterium]
MTRPPDHRALTLPAASKNWALFLDIDGTLLDLAPTPDAVVVPPGLLRVLEDVSEVLDGAAAFVSGRPIEWIDRLFRPLSWPAAGQHGAEIRLTRHDPIQSTVEVPDLSKLRARTAAIAAATPGVLVEDKSFGVALHYRNAPERGPELRESLEGLLRELKSDLQLLRGKMVFEIKAVSAWKERAVEIFMELEPFRGRVPVVIGDDTTDEGAFRAAQRRGGHAIQVGPGGSSIASFFIPNPTGVREWLARLPETLQRASA